MCKTFPDARPEDCQQSTPIDLPCQKGSCQSQPPRQSRCVRRREEEDETPMVMRCFLLRSITAMMLSPPLRDSRASTISVSWSQVVPKPACVVPTAKAIWRIRWKLSAFWFMDIRAGIENAAGVVSKLCEPYAEDALKSDCVRSVGWLVCWFVGRLVGWLVGSRCWLVN